MRNKAKGETEPLILLINLLLCTRASSSFPQEAWSEHIPQFAPGNPERANLRARSSRQDPSPTATGVAAPSKFFQRAHPHFQRALRELILPWALLGGYDALNSFAGESGLIAFVTTTEEKNYSHWEYFSQAPPSYLTIF